jgi:hypothetical protein
LRRGRLSPMKRHGFVLVFLLFGMSGCGEAQDPPMACAAYATAGLSVSVQSATSGQPICDASVIASEGSYSERLYGSACNFTGAYERAGNYVVRASREGYRAAEVGPVVVVMGGGQCPHVELRRVTIQLTPES